MSFSTADLRNTLKARIEGAAIGPGFSWTNVNYDGTRPYFEVSTQSADRDGGGIKGDAYTREVGVLAVVVVVDQGGGENAALGYADQIAALFPMGSRIPFNGGVITILRHPDINGGFPDEVSYRVPVTIRYSALSQ